MAHSNARKTVPKTDLTQYVVDLDTNGNHDLDLSTCPGIEMKSEISFDLLTVGYATQHNTYFKYKPNMTARPKPTNFHSPIARLL